MLDLTAMNSGPLVGLISNCVEGEMLALMAKDSGFLVGLIPKL
jgi:hypothetical protein